MPSHAAGPQAHHASGQCMGQWPQQQLLGACCWLPGAACCCWVLRPRGRMALLVRCRFNNMALLAGWHAAPACCYCCVACLDAPRPTAARGRRRRTVPAQPRRCDALPRQH
jgi:hypothetical protein